MQRVTGSPPLQKLLDKNANGPSKHRNRLSKHKNKPSKNVNGLSKRCNGPNRKSCVLTKNERALNG
jgi:hypothetical protein